MPMDYYPGADEPGREVTKEDLERLGFLDFEEKFKGLSIPLDVYYKKLQFILDNDLMVPGSVKHLGNKLFISKEMETAVVNSFNQPQNGWESENSVTGGTTNRKSQFVEFIRSLDREYFRNNAAAGSTRGYGQSTIYYSQKLLSDFRKYANIASYE